jgi:hypothetical protein
MRDKLLQLLDRSERAICEAALRMEAQRAIISRMNERESGSDVALSLLRQFERNLGLLVTHRDQLLRATDRSVACSLPRRRRRREAAEAEPGHRAARTLN